jgi:phosphopantothenoylcysteine decarboxylase/phosphopantothenate--cysteine ligase
MNDAVSDTSTTSAEQVSDTMAGRRILLGVSGGIAAYKAPMLVRRLREAGADIQVVLTANAHHFVTATSLQAVSGRPIRDDLWDATAEAAMGHIELARWADIVVIAPASADLMARLAQGRADDLLTTLCLATRAPILLAPAMNHQMWRHPATQRNVATLRECGCAIAGPADGPQACGEFGPGRMLEPDALAALTRTHLLRTMPTSPSAAQATTQSLLGKRVLITAGPTREAIDPVRYISNHSSGKQGYAIAAAALRAGASVTLVSGPVQLAAPPGARVVHVTSAVEMDAAVQAHATDCDVFIGVAAVADYRPDAPAQQKMKKLPERDGRLTLTLIENPDIIARVAARSDRPFVVGFAAETHDTLQHARDKRARKGLDMIVVNDVSRGDIGFNADTNDVMVIWSGGETHIAKADKAVVADQLVAAIGARLAASGSSNAAGAA